jgi:hypothetical protein
MGQAKARGTKDQRIIEGEQKAREKEVARKRATAEYEASLTPEDRAKRDKARTLLAGMLSMTSETIGMNKVLKMLS